MWNDEDLRMKLKEPAASGGNAGMESARLNCWKSSVKT